MAIVRLSPKDPAETVLVSFDFENLLIDATEVLNTVVWTAEVVKGIDPTPSLILSGTPTVGVSSSVGYVTGGVADVTYLVEVVATTTKGQVLKLSATIKIEEQS